MVERKKTLRLLIDACLTPTAIAHLTKIFGKRINAIHVDRVLPPATADDAVFDWAVREQRVVITANNADFLKILLRKKLVHSGLGCINEQNTRVRQIQEIERLVRALLSHIDEGKLVRNQVFVMRRSGRLAVRRIPPDIPPE
ncbi:MAG TPA: DUF5615 family PIN-like protein [Candidatus Baltobacteraceae bacterium]|jgi:predicted nuclease of predicted toxin-antitoxin system|nr:DUF5615 family PIN-like protein [Candidatus Baltobacteraceae bacterium]